MTYIPLVKVQEPLKLLECQNTGSLSFYMKQKQVTASTLPERLSKPFPNLGEIIKRNPMRELYVKMIFHSKQRRNFIILIFEIGLNIGSTAKYENKNSRLR